MSKLFFEDLRIPTPDIELNIGSASHTIQTAGIMVAFEDLLLSEQGIFEELERMKVEYE